MHVLNLCLRHKSNIFILSFPGKEQHTTNCQAMFGNSRLFGINGKMEGGILARTEYESSPTHHDFY